MNIQIRQAEVRDVDQVSSILIEAAEWLRARGVPLWRPEDLAPGHLAADVARGDFFIAESGGVLAGTVKFQLQDEIFWPDAPADEAAFIHRLAVRRAFAGGSISGLLPSVSVC